MYLICTRCKEQQENKPDNFRVRCINNRQYVNKQCRACERQRALEHRNNNLSAARSSSDKWHKDNPKYKIEWKRQNPEKEKRYSLAYERKRKNKIQNDPEYRAKRRTQQAQTIARKRASSVTFRLKQSVSVQINKSLRSSGITKAGKVTFDYLPYSLDELKQHLESQFEPWMNWDNWGKYNVNMWDDLDPETWAWQLDHIIPASEFNYRSMQDLEFLQCWSLNNLRPLSAKANVQDGARRTRHKKV